MYSSRLSLIIIVIERKLILSASSVYFGILRICFPCFLGIIFIVLHYLVDSQKVPSYLPSLLSSFTHSLLPFFIPSSTHSRFLLTFLHSFLPSLLPESSPLPSFTPFFLPLFHSFLHSVAYPMALYNLTLIGTKGEESLYCVECRMFGAALSCFLDRSI